MREIEVWRVIVRRGSNACVSRPMRESWCNSITLDRPLAHTRAQTRDPLHTSTTVTLEASLPIAALAEQGELLLQGLRASDVTD